MSNPLRTGTKAGCSIAAVLIALPILAIAITLGVWFVWALVKAFGS